MCTHMKRSHMSSRTFRLITIEILLRLIVWRMLEILVWTAFLGAMVYGRRRIERTSGYQEPLEDSCLIFWIFTIYHITLVKFHSSFKLVLQDTIVLSLGTHLEEDSLLELEVLPHDVGDVRRLDREGDGYVRLFEEVVHLHQIMVVLQSIAKKFS